MLLRRVMEHVRGQNWIAVWLDLFIVVIGVFIGIQVSNWNDQRQSKVELAASLENLAQEISNTATRREDQLQWQHRIIRGHQLMLDLLDGAALDDEERPSAAGNSQADWLGIGETFNEHELSLYRWSHHWGAGHKRVH